MDTPLVGRDVELAVIDDAFAAASAGTGRLVVVSGPAGIGKTALVGAAGRRFAAAGARVLTGTCPSDWGVRVSYAPFLAACREFAGFGDLLAGAGEIPAEVAHTVVCDRILAAVAGWAEDRPVVLVIEDAHWLDRGSAALVELLARAAGALPLLLLLTVRPFAPPPADHGAVPASRVVPVARGELADGAPDWVPTERNVVATTARSAGDGAVARLLELASGAGSGYLPLGRLADEAIAALVRDRVPEDRLDSVVRRSAGHPLFARELAARPDERLPATLRLLLAHRLEALGPSGAQVVGAVSLAGPHATDRVLTDVCGRDADEVIRAGLAAGLLDRDPANGGLRPSHGLIGEAAEAQLGADGVRRLHRRLAEVLAVRTPAPDPAVLAGHWQRGGEPARALPAWLAGAEEATRRNARPVAADAYRHVLALLDAVESTVDRSAVVLGAADALRLSGEVDEAIQLLRAELTRQPPLDDPARCRLLDRLRQNLYAAGESAAAFAVHAEARALVAGVDDPAVRARIEATEGVRLMLAGRYGPGAAASRTAATLAGKAGEIEVRIRAMSTLGICTAFGGDEDAGVAQLVRAKRLAERTGTVDGLVHAVNNLAVVLANATRYAEAAHACRETLSRLAARGMAGAFGGHLRCNLAMSLVALGEWTEVERLCTVSPGGRPTAKTHAHLLLCRAEVAARRGGTGLAEELLAEADRLGVDNEVFAVEAAYVAAVVARGAGRYRRAVTGCQEALARQPAPGPADRLRLAAVGLGALADLELAGGRVRRLDDPYGVAAELIARAGAAGPQQADATTALLSPEAGALAALCRAEADRLTGPDPAQWADVVGRWDAAGLPWYAAYARLRWAGALVGSRSPGPVGDVLRDAHRVARALEAEPLSQELARIARRARVPLGTADPVRPVADTLTRREREVLEQLAWGRTNQEIAHSLVISVRTAGVHVSHILAKLGAANRAEAARIARDLLEPSR